MLYRKSANLMDLISVASTNMINASMTFKVKHRDPTTIGWLKRNTEAFRISTMRCGLNYLHMQE